MTPEIIANLERRSFPLTLVRIEKHDGQQSMIEGHAAVFGQKADLWGMTEEIAPGAFAESIAKDDIRALFNHDPNFVLGRNKAGSLVLREDEKGLFISNIPPLTQWARDLVVSIERGDISQMSFGFSTLNDEWKTVDGTPHRILRKVQLFDVSPVTFPAYPQTDVGVALRSLGAFMRKAGTACPVCAGCGRTVAMEDGEPKITSKLCPGCSGSGARAIEEPRENPAAVAAAARGRDLQLRRGAVSHS